MSRPPQKTSPNNRLRIVAATASLCAAISAQDPAAEHEPDAEEVDLSPVSFETDPSSGLRYHFAPVEGVGHAAVVLGVRTGSMHDPVGRAGLAAVIGEILRLYFADDGRDRLGVSVRVDRDATSIVATCDSDSFLDLCGALAPILARARTSLPVDLVARAKAKCKLRADDVESVLPGPILRAHAARVRLQDAAEARLPDGSAEQIEAVRVAEVEARLARAFVPSAAFLVVVGELPVDPAAGVAALVGQRRAGDVATEQAARGRSVLAPIRHEREPSVFEFRRDEAVGMDVADHRLVDAPFVTASLSLPSFGEADFAAHWIAVGVLRGRAVRAFQPFRGGELAAEFPFVDFDPFVAPRMVCVQRRGMDGHDLGRVRAEIEGVFADLRSHGASAGEIASAARQLAATLALPPFDSPSFLQVAARQPQVLTARAYVIAAYERHGWPASLPALLEKTPITHVHRVVAEMFDKARVEWAALQPTVADGNAPASGWRRAR